MQTRSRGLRPSATALAVAAVLFLPAWTPEPTFYRPLAQPRNALVYDVRPPSYDGYFRSFGRLPETPYFRVPDRVRILHEVNAILLEEPRAADGRVAAKKEAPPRRSIRTFDEKTMVGAPYSNEILEAAKVHRVDPALIAAVIRAESNFVPSAISRNGACGLMQLMPATARRLGVDRAFDPRENIRGGTAYLAELADRFGETAVELILAAYNAGEQAVEDFGGVPPYRQTRAYVRRVSTLWQEALAARPTS
ncbi:MAG: lytic transglycosylase domain-containing protein [Thermoanaerobaculia bacterium]